MSDLPKKYPVMIVLLVCALFAPWSLAAQTAPDPALEAELQAVARDYALGRTIGAVGTGVPGTVGLLVGGTMVVTSLATDTGWSDVTLVLGGVGTGAGLGLSAATVWQILVPSAVEDAASGSYTTQEDLETAVRLAISRVEKGRKIRGGALVVGAGLLAWMAVREAQTSGNALNAATALSLVTATAGVYDLAVPSLAARRLGPLLP